MSNNNKMPEGWGQNKSVPDSWKKANSLPENWGKQSGGNRVPGTFSAADTDQTQESNVRTSELVHTGAGLLTGAAKKISGAAKNAAGSAGAAMADMKDKAASAAAEHKTAGENKAETEYQEVTDYSPSQEGPNRTVEEMIEEVLSASGNDGEGAEYDTVTEEQKVVDNTPINSVSEPLVGQSTVQNERYYEQPVDQPQDQNAGYYEQPVGDQMQLYGYKEKKSPIVYVMAGIIAVLLVGGGILGGMLIMKDKGDKSDRAASSASDVNSKTTDESISAENTSIDGVDEKSTDPDHHSLDDKASSLQKAAESALTDIDAKYGLNSTNKVLFSSDTNYRFYSDDEFSSYADEFEEELKNYFNDVENLNYILEINGGSCIATVVENANGEIGRFPSINNIEDYNMDLFIPKSGGTFKEIADQALANAKKYKEENTTVTEKATSPATAGNKLKFYSSDKINDYPAYLEKLRDLQTNGTYRDQNNGFFLCDINEDDTPELFVTFNTDEPGILFAGSVYSGELVPFAEFMGAGMLRGITLFDNGAIGITSAGNEGHGISYKYYNGGNSFSDQNNNDESISYIYENGSLSYISYQNGGQEKHITEAEVEQIQKKYVEASYTAAPVSSVIENESSSKFSNQELGYMYNQYYIRAYTDGSIGGGYIIDYDKDGTDELICSAQGGLWIIKYQNGDTQSAGQVSQNISSTYYGREELKNKLLELTEKYGYGVNSNFVYNSDPAIGFVSTSDMFGTLNLRKEPSTNSEVITQLPNGLMFNSTSNPYDKSAFCYITTTYNGQTYSGYVSSDYVVLFEKGL